MSDIARRFITILITVVISMGLAVAAAGPAFAAGSYPTLAEANIRSAPTTTAPISGVVIKGTKIVIDCYAEGQLVNGTNIWDHIPGQGWISDSLVLTGSDDPVVPPCAGEVFNRQAAANWALAHVNDAQLFDNDCTWFVSNALWAGGLSRTTGWSNASPNPLSWAKKTLPGPTKAAASADHLKNELQRAGYAKLSEIKLGDRSAGGAQIGDVILYDWDGKPNGVIDHAAIVTAIGPDGTVYVTQHSIARENRQWNADGAGQPIPADKRAYLLHITK